MTVEVAPDRTPPVPSKADVVVIGAGLGGLSCALDLALNGLDVCVLEQRSAAGGYAAAFQRDGFVFDVSANQIGGLAPGKILHRVLSDYGIVDKLTLTRRKTILTVDFPGLSVAVPNDPGEIIRTLAERFPKERDNLAALFDHAVELKHQVVAPWIDPHYDTPADERLTAAYSNRTFADLLGEFVSDPELAAVLTAPWMSIGLPPSRSAALFSACVFASVFVEGSYSIRGGGRALADAMVHRLEELGGKCIVRAPVRRIAVRGSAVAGVELENGELIEAATAVSNADPYQTFFELVPEEHVSRIYRYRLDNMEPSLSLYAMYLGLDCPPGRLGIPDDSYIHHRQLDCEEAYRRFLSHDIDRSSWHLCNRSAADPEAAQQGLGAVSITELTPAGDWLDLSEAGYRARKRAVADRLLEKYAARFPGLRDHAVVKELATPATLRRYTRNRGGAVFGFAQIPEQSNGKRLVNKTPVKGLYLTGAWTWAGGGYEGAILSGVQTSRAVLKDAGAPTRPVSAGPGRADAADHFRFHLPVRVCHNDLNAGGIADPNALLRYMDRGRVEAIEALCREAGRESWLKRFIVNVYRVDLLCLGAAQVGDLLAVQTGIRKTSSHRASFDQRIATPDGREIIADASVEVLFLESDKKLVPVPDIVPQSEHSWLEDRGDRLKPVPFGHEAHFKLDVPLRVYYEDTDAQGITYHVSYFRFCQAALVELFQKAWPADPDLAREMMRRANIRALDVRYLNASSLGDQLVVRTGGRLKSAHALFLDQRIVSETTGKIIVDMMVELEFKHERKTTMEIPEQMIRICSDGEKGT